MDPDGNRLQLLYIYTLESWAFQLLYMQLGQTSWWYLLSVQIILCNGKF